MPLILLVGLPGSGKSTRCKQLSDFFANAGKQVVIVSMDEEIQRSNLNKNAVFMDPIKEKQLGFRIISKAHRLKNKVDLVIVDSLYSKEDRFELRRKMGLNLVIPNIVARHCTLYTEIEREMAWSFNIKKPIREQWTRETFDNLANRTRPDREYRHNGFLYHCTPADVLEFQTIWNILGFGKCPIPPSIDILQNAYYLYSGDRSEYIKDVIVSLDAVVNELSTLIKTGMSGTQRLHDVDINISARTLETLRLNYSSYKTYRQWTYDDYPWPSVASTGKLFMEYLNSESRFLL